MTGIAIVDTETVGLNAQIHGIWEVAVILHAPPDKDGNAPDDEEYLWQLPVDLSLADPDALRISQYYARRWRQPPPMPPGYHPEEYFDDAVTGYRDDRFRPDLNSPPRDDERFHVPVECMHTWATRFASLTAGRILVGAVPSFDEKRLGRLLREFGVAPAWHYRPICVETLAAGYIRGFIDLAKAEPAASAWNESVRRDKLGIASHGDIAREGKIPLPWSSASLSAALGVPRSHGAHTALGDCRWVRDLWVKIMEDA